MHQELIPLVVQINNESCVNWETHTIEVTVQFVYIEFLRSYVHLEKHLSMDIDSADDSELQELQELSEWVTSQRITDDVIDLSEFNSSYFESDGTELNSNGHINLPSANASL